MPKVVGTVMAEVVEPPRKSLLDVVQEKLFEEDKKSFVTRVVLGGFREDKLTEEAIYFIEKEILEKHAELDEALTGIIFMYPRSYMVVLEGPEASMRNIMRAFGQSEYQKHGIIEMKVMVYCEDVPFRMFTFWAQPRNLTIPNGEPLMDGATARQAISMIYQNLGKLGKKLLGLERGKDEDAIRAILGALKTTYASLMPTNDVLNWVVEHEDVPTIEDYMNLFEEPIDLVLESELVWPMRTRLRYDK